MKKDQKLIRWIISKLNSLVEEYEQLMDDYDVTKAARASFKFYN
ncbi:MAG: class I tRNA ligase family protein [Ignavibacteriales bacterium]|nr:class I tRNA ligase family protein [Ignavibacteriales bacterium]